MIRAIFPRLIRPREDDRCRNMFGKPKQRPVTILKGEMNEVNESVVITKLRKMNYTDIKVKKKPKDLFENIEFFQPKVTTKDVVIFTRQFATMIDAGLPLVQCLEILASQQENKTFKKVLTQVKTSVEGRQHLCRRAASSTPKSSMICS